MSVWAKLVIVPYEPPNVVFTQLCLPGSSETVAMLEVVPVESEGIDTVDITDPVSVTEKTAELLKRDGYVRQVGF